VHQAEARRILTTLRDELVEAEAAVVAAEKRVSALTKLINGYVELFPDLGEDASIGDAGSDGRPRGVEAVRRVMMESPGKWFTVKLMTSELRSREWLPESANPESAVRTSLTRAFESSDDIQKDRGKQTGQVTFSFRPADRTRSWGDGASDSADVSPESYTSPRPALAFGAAVDDRRLERDAP
jgi:hypothetical protein